jgi:immunoglobulin-binding protein 1
MDYRERNGQRRDDYSDRLDPSVSSLLNRGKAGPILSKDGKPLKPFTLLDNRQRLRDGVFRPDHSLPTMTIDEYLAEERRRGGMVDGGDEQSGRSAEIDEDNLVKADAETMKAREWDEFTEANPKGSGNTINRG